ncbi:MAG TPA: hypothetical protein VFO36_01785 [Nitrospiraceae bacterium]|nr:hypothetical protein [Nitrospiraceae bacterium]
MKTVALLVLALVAGPLSAEVGWKDKDGKTVPQTESLKSVAGFGGLLIVTPDKDWEEKWNSPAPPDFSATSTVKKGGELFILTIYTNPELDASGEANVTLDIDVRRPDGSSSTDAKGAVCFQGKLRGPPHNVYLCGPVVGFIGEPSDPVGEWSVRIKLIDNVRKVEVPLSTTFTLVNDETKR